MRRREYYWSLFHTPVKNQVDNLRTDQVEAVFAAIPPSMRPEWLIWRDGFEQWKPFADFPQLLLSLRKADDRQFESPPQPPPKQKLEQKPETKARSSFAQSAKPAAKSDSKSESKSDSKSARPHARTQPTKRGDGTISDIIFDEDTEDPKLSLEKTGVGEDRSNFRFERALDVRIVVGDEVYKNVTVDISLKGMQFREPLPKRLPTYFNVEIYKGKRMIPVVCSEVRRDGKSTNRVKIEVNDFSPGLLAMLLEG